jgi:hypothetical protein
MIHENDIIKYLETSNVQVFQWYRTEQDVPAIQMNNATSAGPGEDHMCYSS